VSERVADIVAARLATGDAGLDELLRAVRDAGGRGGRAGGVDPGARQRCPVRTRHGARQAAVDPDRARPRHGASGCRHPRRSGAPDPPAEPVRWTPAHPRARRARAPAVAGRGARRLVGTCRGVIEAVTGTGKTRLAIAASRTVLDRGGRVLVLVPTLELLDQWRPRAAGAAARRERRAARWRRRRRPVRHQIVLATPHSAAGVPIDLPPGARAWWSPTRRTATARRPGGRRCRGRSGSGSR
jgi:hypothetical protein